MISFLFRCWWKHEWVTFGNSIPNEVPVTWDGKVPLMCGKCFHTIYAETYTSWVKRKFDGV